jgi:hypothetical protein
MTGLRTRARVARRGATLTVAGLVTVLLPLTFTLTVTPAAHAAPETCPSEAYDEPLLLTGCDDAQPPTTTITSVSPTSNADDFIRSTSVTFTFAGAHAGDDDTGTIGVECQLYNTATPPDTWQSCASPKTYTGLEEHATTPYTFRVRAVDVTDEAIPARAGNPLTPPDLDEHDRDASPAASTLKVDSLAPNTFVTDEPVDRIRPDWPVVLADAVTLGLHGSEPSTFACTVNGGAVTPCVAGQVALRNLAPGDTTFVARAVDRALNLDPTPATTRFFVPSDIRRTKASRWKNVRKIGRGLFDNDYVESRRVGRTLVVPGVRKVREVRLVALVGPKGGKVEVRVGRSQWYTVNLYAKRARITQLLVRDEFSPLQSGTIQIRVKSLRGPGSSVRLDALVARA